MIKYSTEIKKFDKQGEKTGWTYVDVPAELAEQLKPGNKKSFRVKGKLDHHPIEGVALLPMGGGDFIIPLNGEMRKAIGKTKGAILQLQLQLDEKEYQLCPDLLLCLQDEPAALENFNKLPPSHRKYYSKWIESARTEPTKAKRIAQAVNALAKSIGYGEMLKEAGSK
ncbi:YdeI/OmpD-associated family protein [Aridibaculum aurantiacum]|uniref:YdeI/OmpD-associated family protein n=1 Tax=Aridibaculum aurantiacum TaxID=2810307 RepID=UPI001A957AA7|nr:YdeI/OmpD-associated family protein [Aridibaculum aurantiacum]